MGRRSLFLLFVTLLAGAPGIVNGQPPPGIVAGQPQLRYDRGQDVWPVFEGWIRNPDQTVSMVFGYMNRNWEEQPSIPVGPNNNIEPGGPDRGQPTHFYPRRNRYLFAVQLPKDWKKEDDLVWTLIHAGHTRKAYASLLPVEEITLKNFRSGGNFSVDPDKEDLNQAPVLTVDPKTADVTVPHTVTLTAAVTDDGLPKHRSPRPLTLTWIAWRGPAEVTFSKGQHIVQNRNGTMEVQGDPVPPDGKFVTQASFKKPGNYILRATAGDGGLLTPADVTIAVK